MASVVRCCFIAQLPDLEPIQKTRITAWGNPRCREFRIIPSAAGTVVCGILVTAPATAKGFLRLWITNTKNWKIPPGPAYRPGKLRLLTLVEYQAEMGHSPSVTTFCSDLVDQIVGGVFMDVLMREEIARDEVTRLAAMTAQNNEWHQDFLRGQKRLRDQEAEDAAHSALQCKLEDFWIARKRMGDTLEGTFVPDPTDRLAPRNGPKWWCTDAEAAMDSWKEVLQSRADTSRVADPELVFE
jgi:hypothetical protein